VPACTRWPEGAYIKRDIVSVKWEVLYLPEARAERSKLPANERVALDNVVHKLEAVGPDLGHPHSTSIRQTEGLRELRPRRGSSSWRGIYRRIGETFVIAAVCPEAQNSAHGFRRGCDAAAERLAELEE
jgi:hypothetical protein